MKATFGKRKFVCPECGSQEPEPTSLVRAPKAGPGMRRGYVCAKCYFEIPAHLGERWGGISIQDARREWLEAYRHIAETQETRIHESEHSH
jgi:DNA-directed RNA polymerase subunit RPC12/RpoP